MFGNITKDQQKISLIKAPHIRIVIIAGLRLASFA
jgi:hypothetical protein